MDSGLRIVDSGLWTTDRTVVIMRLVIFHVSWLKCLFEHGQGPRPRAPLTNSSSFSLLSVFPLFFFIFATSTISKEALKNRHGMQLFVIYCWRKLLTWRLGNPLKPIIRPHSTALYLRFSISLMTETVKICFLIKRKYHSTLSKSRHSKNSTTRNTETLGKRKTWLR